MAIKYLKKATKTPSTDDDRTRQNVQEILKDLEKRREQGVLEISKKTNTELVNVFVPTTPNPTSGFLLMFPKSEIIYLDMSFEEASKFIVSAGTSDQNSK